jgi:tryptophan synthase alpha chain
LTVSRIDARFAALKAEGRAAFVPYVMAGDPHAEVTLEILRGLPAAGADLIELGFPFSDPMAEGVPIQKAAQRALQAGMTLRRTLELVRSFRGLPSPSRGEGPGMGVVQGLAAQADAPTDVSSSAHHPLTRPLPPLGGKEKKVAAGDMTTPVILMGYLNNVLSYGFEAFARDASAAGVDGLIIVDCPPEEAGPLADALDAESVALIRLATPTSDDARLKVIAARTSGFVYYVSVAGVTGQKEADETAVAPHVERVRKASGLPVAVGFGIRTPERAAAVARVADAAVVGSALVDEIAAAIDLNQSPATRVLELASRLAEAVHAAREPVSA